ncbi:tetratricopeptide repeat protein, partial [candidate division KSB1 bacterium]|nr:tetratricopeptide repeat protein [candidate division KSB1 bacterium]
MSDYLTRAQILLNQSRDDQAEAELRKRLAEQPEDPIAHALLALSLRGQGKMNEALREARQAVGFAPHLSFVHYVLAEVLHQNEQYEDAKFAVEEAIRLDPEEADYYGRLSSIFLDLNKWKEAVEAAEQGLAMEPENVTCTNCRAIALIKLGRKIEAGESIETALSHDPENPITHANLGWTLLHQNKPAAAMESFREALRLDPMLEWARRGILHAMKARNPIYRLFLNYLLWMSRLSKGARWGLVIGVYILFRILSGVNRTIPALTPILTPLLILYLLFVLLTWTAQPLFNLLLRFNRFGRLVLSREEKMASNWVAFCVAIALLLAFAGVIWGPGILILGAIGAFLMIIPISGIFYAHSKKSRFFLILYALGMGLAGTGSLVLGLLGVGPYSALASLFLIGFVAY